MAPRGRGNGTTWGSVLVALALAVFALLPHGVMPARIAGTMTVVICTGNGPMTLVTDSRGLPVAPAPMGRDTDAKAPCGFALLAAAATLPEAPVLPLPDARLRSFHPTRRPPLAVLAAEVLSPSARGPPRLA